MKGGADVGNSVDADVGNNVDVLGCIMCIYIYYTYMRYIYCRY